MTQEPRAELGVEGQRFVPGRVLRGNVDEETREISLAPGR